MFKRTLGEKNDWVSRPQTGTSDDSPPRRSGKAVMQACRCRLAPQNLAVGVRTNHTLTRSLHGESSIKMKSSGQRCAWDYLVAGGR